MAKPAAEKRPLIEVLNELSLEDIRAEIGTHEEKIKHHQAQIDSLRVLEKAVDIRINGKPERAPRQAKQKPAASPRQSGSPIRDKVAQYLRSAGRAKPAVIAADIGELYQSVYGVLNKEAGFVKHDDGSYSLEK